MMTSFILKIRKHLPVSEKTELQLQEVFRHCDIRLDGWGLHLTIVLLALMSYHLGVQLSSPRAEVELSYFVRLMSQAIAMQLWELTTSFTMMVFLFSAVFKSLSRVTLWAAGALISASIWGVFQYYLMIGKASYEGIMAETSNEVISAFYLLPVFGFWWVFLMLIQAHLGLVVFRTTNNKTFFQSWHKLPVLAKLVLPIAFSFALFLHFYKYTRFQS